MPERDATASEVEAVARAISDADGSDAWGAYTDMARAALDEVRAAGRAEDQYRRALERIRDHGETDPAAVEAAVKAYRDWTPGDPPWMQTAIAAYLDHSGLAEARASLERERKARHAVEKVNADEVLRKRTNLEARIEVAEMERDEAVVRAERAEADAMSLKLALADAREDREIALRKADGTETDLAVYREALEKIATRIPPPERDTEANWRWEVAREALSRLDHSSEEER